MAIRKVGVVGCGLMGSGIAQVCAQSGYETLVTEARQELLDKGLGRIRSFLEEGVKRGKVVPDVRDKTLANLAGTMQLADFRDCDLVVEAVLEKMDEKRRVFGELDRACKPETILASNTSSLSITEIASATKRPDRVLGMHFFNPVPIMKLLEIVRPEVASEATYQAARVFGATLGKTVITAKDTPGFIVNLLLVPYLLDAVRAVQDGVATPEDLDNGMRLGCNHPMGPIELLDYVGLDTTYYIAESMYQEFKDGRYAAPPLLKRMVLAGLNGRKCGRGFYRWEGNKRVG